jgi:hypothetical protein
MPRLNLRQVTQSMFARPMVNMIGTLEENAVVLGTVVTKVHSRGGRGGLPREICSPLL